jgi:hypothetical protein
LKIVLSVKKLLAKLTIMKKNLIMCILSALLLSKSLIAQDTSKIVSAVGSSYTQNSWYFEFGGASILGVTFNYERSFSKKPGGFYLRAGAGGGFLWFWDDVASFGALPVGLGYNIPISPDKKDFLDIGGTYTFLFANGGNADVLSPNISWRHVVKPKGLQFRATLIPFYYSVSDHSGFGPWFGFSIGKRF